MDLCTRQLGGIYNTSETGCQCSSCATPPQHHHGFYTTSPQRRSITSNPHIHTITCCSRCTSIITDNSSTCNCSTFAANHPPKLHVKKQGWGCKRAGCANGVRSRDGDGEVWGLGLNEVLVRWLDALLGHIVKARSTPGFRCAATKWARRNEEGGLMNADRLTVAAESEKERVDVDEAALSEGERVDERVGIVERIGLRKFSAV